MKTENKALKWWNDLSLQNHERPANCRSGYVAKHYPQKDDCNDVTNAEIVYMYKQEHKVPVEINDGSVKEFPKVMTKANLEKLFMNFAKDLSYEFFMNKLTTQSDYIKFSANWLKQNVKDGN